MKAIEINEFGPAENLKINEHSMPSIAEDEVLIKTEAMSINPVDTKTRQGKALKKTYADKLPAILGWDVSGTVAKKGANVTQFEEGDDVFGMIRFPDYAGAYAEYVAAPVDHLAAKPENISHSEAAASTLAALTAWQAFTHFGTLNEGDRVLIHAASGGVGHFAVQIAKHLGAGEVIGTSSAKNRDFVMSLGADRHLDYTEVTFEEELSDIDFCLETIGGDHVTRSVEVMKPGGTLISLLSNIPDEAKDKARAKNLNDELGMLVFADGEGMEAIAELLADGIITPHVSKTYDAKDMDKAHKQIETGHTVGKVTISF